MTTASEVAQWFRSRSAEDDRRISNKKLQKLVYYGQAWPLALNHRSLFDDPIEAWIHGPVVRSVYQQYRHYGWTAIPPDGVQRPALSSEDEDLLENVWEIYGPYDADYLETLTHYERPWQAAREELEFNERSNAVMDTTGMARFYRELLEVQGNHDESAPDLYQFVPAR